MTARRSWAGAWLGALLALVAGCYETPQPACAFRCGPMGSCPTGYICGVDGQCHLFVNGAAAECEALPAPPDAAEVQIDAAPTFDATPIADAPIVPDAT